MTNPNFFYVLLDVKHPGYPAAIIEYEKQHRLAWPANNLSVVLNVARTQALVKVDAGKDRPAWSAAAALKSGDKSVVLRTWTFKEHAQVIELLKTKEWRLEDTLG